LALRTPPATALHPFLNSCQTTMTDTFRALCAELVELDQAEPGDYANWRQSWNAAIARARAALAQPEPQGPTDEELLRIYRVATPCYQVEEYKRELDFARAVLARWGRPAIAALRAAADQIKPHISRTPWLTNEDGYFNETFQNYEALGQLIAHDRLLAIAAELEGAE